MRRTICRIQASTKVFQKLVSKMAQNQVIEEALHNVTTIFQALALQDNLQRFTVKKRVVRAIDRPYLPLIPFPISAEFYNKLREKLEIQGEVHGDNNLAKRRRRCRSPLKLADTLAANGDATEAAVIKLFEKQYEIKWQTETGDPDQFSFYKFCKNVVKARGNPGGQNVMTYDTRRAHVISKLYHAQEKLRNICNQTHRQLCPPVYVRTLPNNSWTKWICNPAQSVFEATDEETDIDSWITNVPLRNYITAHSVENSADRNLPNEVGHLYWAVLEEDDYDNDRKPLETLPFRTQVYVGRAKNGITERWTGGGTSHCKRMEFARDVMCDMLSYNPTALRSEQLVDLRLLLHKACNQEGENSGLFIMEQFTTEVVVNDTQQIIGDKSRLDPAESKNINGKKTSSDEFILNVRQNENWIPKHMNYGMNKRA